MLWFLFDWCIWSLDSVCASSGSMWAELSWSLSGFYGHQVIWQLFFTVWFALCPTEAPLCGWFSNLISICLPILWLFFKMYPIITGQSFWYYPSWDNFFVCGLLRLPTLFTAQMQQFWQSFSATTVNHGASQEVPVWSFIANWDVVCLVRPLCKLEICIQLFWQGRLFVFLKPFHTPSLHFEPPSDQRFLIGSRIMNV